MLTWLFGLAVSGIAATTPPTHRVERLEIPGVSSDSWESHPAIDPATGDFWFVRSDKDFSGWRIMVSRCENGRLSKPLDMPFAGPGLEADPYFTADGSRLYFISTRASGLGSSKALDIWIAQRPAGGAWQPPRPLPAPVNSGEAEWFPRPAPDGWLYFGSRRAGGLGKDDIWRARQERKDRWVVENMGASINTEGAEYEFQPSPDGRWAILSTDQGLFRVEKTATGWQRKEKFGPEVNADNSSIGPLIAPDGRGFVFSRDAMGGKSGELFAVDRDRQDAWPLLCGARR